jgi:ethanolamine ammonia-lyase small subunit
MSDHKRDHKPRVVIHNPWAQLRQFTAARIALGRSGASLPTAPQLAFQLAHAKARDAVHLALDVPQLAQSLADAGVASSQDCLALHSAAPDRLTYLQRPDLGRRLSDESRRLLATQVQQGEPPAFDIAFVIADGLSARAVMQNAAPLMTEALRTIRGERWSVAPLVIVEQGRVAIGDEIAGLLCAKLVVILIGERPGLSSPDSLGAYLTWAPRVGCLDADRNCISNIRPAGLPFAQAAARLHYLAAQMHSRQLSGVMLKDETAQVAATRLADDFSE